MDKNRKTAIAIAIAAVVLLGVLYFLAQGKERYIWSETYNDDGVQPYDLSLFKGDIGKVSRPNLPYSKACLRIRVTWKAAREIRWSTYCRICLGRLY